MKAKLFFSLLIFACFSFNSVYATTYYSKSAGSLNVVGTWGTVANGSGASPLNFTTAGNTFIIVNNAAPTIAAAWTVSGAGSVIQVGDGTQTINFTIPTAFRTIGTINVMSSSTLTINNATNPTLGTLSLGSAVVYSDAAAQTILNVTYYNLTLGGSGIKTLANIASSTVTNSLTINAGVSFQLNTNNTYVLTLNGTLAGAGTITGGNVSNLTIGGSGSFGTIIPTAAPLTINNFVINRAGLGSITLGGNVTARTSCNFSNGVLVLNGHTLILGGTLTFPTASTNGTITGSSTSNISITATSITNSLFMTSGAQTLNNLTLNCSGQNLTLGNDLTVSGAYTQTRGIININGNTLTLNGTATFATTAANGTTTGSTASNLIISAATITNSLFLTAGSQTLNNLTLNSAGQTLTLGTPLTVSGAYTQTNGIVKLNAQTLTLTGTITFPAASTNGTITGSNTSNLSISGTSITNTLFFTAAALTLNNFTVNSAGQTLKLGTALTLAGTFTHSNGIIDLNGQTLTCNGPVVFPASVANGSFTGSSSSSLSIATPAGGAITNSMYMTQTNSSTNSLKNVTLNRTGGTLTLGNPLNLIGALIPTVGTFASAGNLTLVASSATVTAYIGAIGGSVTGNVTVQAYEAGTTTGWTLMGSPGLTGRTMADWGNNFFVTCPTCPDGDGSAQNGTAFTSIDAYSETAGGLMSAAPRYIGISNITDAMTIGKGYWVYLGNGPSTTTDIIVNMTGSINQGNFAMPLTRTNVGGGTNATDHGYNLLANPYPAPISWTSLRAGNISVSATMYVYNPDLNGYATFISTSGVSSPAVGSGGIGDKIPAGQGFYVKANAAAVTLTAKEAFKAASNQQLLRISSPNINHVQDTASSQPVLLRLQASGNSMKNETVVYFDPNATVNYNSDYDAISLGVDPGFLGIVAIPNDTAYTIKGLPTLTQNVSMPIKTITSITGSYQIAMVDFQSLPAGACIKLHDNYMNIDWDLKTGPYSCTLNDTEKVARFILNITIDPTLSVSGSSQNPTCINSANGYMVASAAGAAPWNYYWKDANNNIIKTSLNKTTTDTLLNAMGGNYSVDINTVGSCNNGTINFTLQGVLSANASFTPSATLDSLANDTVSILFSNTSTNANSYLWDFGDGAETTVNNPSHTYTGQGTYTVTLAAINQTCGDTSVYYQVITIDTTTGQPLTTGIKALAINQNHMQISRDAMGYYVQFNYLTKTNAVISVQNLLGEKIVADIKQDNVANNKTYVPLGNTENNVLIISVNTSSGEKSFKKVINY
ncbi:MAG: beta strand repeat-containing protein [Bacteroidia bacterium]